MLAFSGILALALILAAVGMVVFRRFRLGDSRQEALAEFATEADFYYAASNKNLVRRWKGAPFGVGDIRRAQNVLTGYRHGRRVVAFDYRYRELNRPSERYVVMVLRLQTALPDLEVVQRRWGSVAREAIVRGRIEGESEQFNREFTVVAADQRYGHAMMHPRMMEFLLAQGDLPWRIEGADLISWGEGELWPATVLAGAEYLAQIADLIPPFVWADYGKDPRLG